ncbi:hypothetical protein I6F15_31300 [Bradyrhizobium sp. BRP14]|nr:hypothetical protein [Bradyrhizobium sp. BRP14]
MEITLKNAGSGVLRNGTRNGDLDVKFFDGRDSGSDRCSIRLSGKCCLCDAGAEKRHPNQKHRIASLPQQGQGRYLAKLRWLLLTGLSVSFLCPLLSLGDLLYNFGCPPTCAAGGDTRKDRIGLKRAIPVLVHYGREVPKAQLADVERAS